MGSNAGVLGNTCAALLLCVSDRVDVRETSFPSHRIPMDSRSAADESSLPIFVVDAFTSEPFRGNPAAVCLIPFGREVSKELKQKIAFEMKHSETAFVSTTREGDTFENGSRFALQWFAPSMEVPLCGHATLATSAVLFHICNNPGPVLEFETLSGTLKARRIPNQKIELDLPAYTRKPVDMEEYEDVVKATVGSLPVEELALAHNQQLIIRLQDTVTRRQLEEFQPKGDREMTSADPSLWGAIVTLKGGSDCTDAEGQPYDFLSRYFAPWAGVLEDPVCGSAHSALGPFWSKRLEKNELYARMCSARGGDINIRVLGDRVGISGRTRVVLRGYISVL